MSLYRNSCNIGSFIEAYRKHRPNFSAIKIYALYLNDRNPESVHDKALSLYHMKIGWMSLMHIST